jgi:MoaA/NifB/PqqE/SkfB family radical SAM enzyme
MSEKYTVKDVDAEIKLQSTLEKRLPGYSNYERVDRPPPKFDMSTNGMEDFGNMISIQVSSSCQLKCVGCRGSFDKDFLKQAHKESFISSEKFKIIVDKCILSGIKCFELTPAIGDPFLDPEVFDKLDYLQNKQEVELIIITTNLLWHDAQSMERMLKYSKLMIVVSLYGTDSQEYKKIAGVNCFDSFLSNFKLLYMVSKNIGINGYVQFTNRTSHVFNSDFPKGDIYYLIKMFSRVLNVFLDNSEIFNINRGGTITTDEMPFTRSDSPTRSGLCPHGPGLGGGILPNGDVLFCPFNDIYRTGVVGNIFTESLSAIYAGEEFQRVVTQHNQNIYTGICESCNESW